MNAGPSCRKAAPLRLQLIARPASCSRLYPLVVVRFLSFARPYSVSAVRSRKPAVLHSGHAPLPGKQPSEFRDWLFGGSSLVFGDGGLYRRSAARPIAFLPQQSVRIRSGILLYCGYAIAFVSLSALPYRILPPCGGRNERFGPVAGGCLPVWKFS